MSYDSCYDLSWHTNDCVMNAMCTWIVLQTSAASWPHSALVNMQVGFVLFVSAGIAAILLLARPVIENTIQAFPYRTSGGKEQPGAPDKSLIPGLDSGPPQDDGGSLFD